MKLRKIGIMVLGCVLLMGMAACSKDKEEVTPDGSTPAQVDPRDAFVGEYTYEVTGKALIHNIPIIDTLSIPLDRDEGEAMIAKEGELNKIIIVADKDTIRAEVTGNQLRLDSGSYAYNADILGKRLSFQLMLSNDRATLEGKQINWESNFLISSSYESKNLDGDGHLKIVAEKKD